MDLNFLSQNDFWKFINVKGFLPAIVILFVVFFCLRLIKQSLGVLGERIPTRRLFLKQISVISRFIVVAIGFFFVAISILDLSGEGVSFFGGLLVFGLSFSSRDLIASLMAGLILLFDRPFNVGDRISFKDIYGEVVEIGLRSVRVVDLDDNLISIPNNQFLSQAVSSANAGNLDQMCVFRFYIGCKEDFLLAEKIIYEAVSASCYVFWDKPIVVYMEEGPVPDGAERFAILLTAKAYVIDGRYETLFATDVNKRVKQAFRQHSISTAGELEWNSPA